MWTLRHPEFHRLFRAIVPILEVKDSGHHWTHLPDLAATCHQATVNLWAFVIVIVFMDAIYIYIYIYINNFVCLHSCLYLLISWAWWYWPLTWLTNHRPSVLWHCWFGHLTCKIVSEMTYNVSSGTLNPTIPYHCHNELNCRLGVKTISSDI